MRTRWPAVLAAIAVLATSCSDVVDGSGTNRHSASATTRPSPTVTAPQTSSFPSTPSTPSTSTSTTTTAPAPAQNFTCPGIVYPAAKLAFTCFSPNLTLDLQNKVWPLVEFTRVDSSGWAAETGAGHWGARGSDTLGDIAAKVRARMLAQNFYGTTPKVVTSVVDDIALSGHPANLLATTITLNPAYAKKIKTRVRVEKLWIIAIETSFGDVSLWYVSLPDLSANRWPYVLQYINSIKVIA